MGDRRRAGADRPLRWAIGAGGSVLAAVALAGFGEVVARGNLVAGFQSYEVTRVRLFGVELLLDRSAGVGDALTATALMLAGVVLLVAARRLSGDRGRAFNRAAWGALFLAADDLLSAHETIGHNLPFLGGLPLVDHPDDAVLAVYAAVVIGFVWRQRTLLVGVGRTPWRLAAVAAGLAVAHDVSPLHWSAIEESLEVLAALAGLAGVIALARHHLGGTDSMPVAVPSRTP